MRYLILIILLFSCGRDEVLVEQIDTLNLSALYHLSQEVEVEVNYEMGAEPFAGKNNKNFYYWSLLEENIESLFTGRDVIPTVTVPKELSEMKQIPKQNKETWSAQQVYDLSKIYRKNYSTKSKAYFWVVFLNGHAESGQNVIGFTIKGSSIIAIFKDVIKNSGMDMDGPMAKYVEQSTLVHEVGHAMGLVNNGVKMKSEHQDVEHGSHCTNTKCVMYYQNEGMMDLIEFVSGMISSGSNILFKDECLKDVQEF